MTYHYRDIDGDELLVEPTTRYGKPAISLLSARRDGQGAAAVHVPVDQVEDLITGIRDTARQAARGQAHEVMPTIAGAVAGNLTDSARAEVIRLGLTEEQHTPVDWQAIAQRREHEMKTLGERKHAVEQERDGAYRERAHLLAWLATLYAPNAVLAPALDLDDEDDWHLLFLTVAGRQLSWHISPRDMDLLKHVERVDFADPRAAWDGHTTEEKYQRIRTMPWGEMRAVVQTTPTPTQPEEQ